jgi:hypothetical protein
MTFRMHNNTIPLFLDGFNSGIPKARLFGSDGSTRQRVSAARVSLREQEPGLIAARSFLF